ncbi:MAG: hypothetical protein ABGY24_10645 [bacterium]
MGSARGVAVVWHPKEEAESSRASETLPPAISLLPPPSSLLPARAHIARTHANTSAVRGIELA